MWLLLVTAPKCFCGNRCAFLPLCLSPGARLSAEADAPSQRERRGSWWRGRSGRIGGRCVPSTAVPPAYCHAQQHLPTSHPVSAGEKQLYTFQKITSGFHHWSAENICSDHFFALKSSEISAKFGKRESEIKILTIYDYTLRSNNAVAVNLQKICSWGRCSQMWWVTVEVFEVVKQQRQKETWLNVGPPLKVNDLNDKFRKTWVDSPFCLLKHNILLLAASLYMEQ